jgi:hypothetical protein
LKDQVFYGTKGQEIKTFKEGKYHKFRRRRCLIFTSIKNQKKILEDPDWEENDGEMLKCLMTTYTLLSCPAIF